jgi:hypothetical protein
MASTKKTPSKAISTSRTHKDRAKRWFSGAASACIVVLLLVLHSAYWMNQNFINSQNFSQKVSSVLALDSSREAIGNEVSDQVFKDKPILGRVAGDKLASIVTSLLGTDIANKLVTRVSNDTVVYLTSPKQKPIEISLSEIKPIIIALSKAVDVVDKSSSVSIDSSTIPDKIVLVEPGTIPSFYKYSVILAWMVPFASLAIIGLFVAIIRLRKLSIRQGFKRAGILLMSSSVLGMIIGPVVKPPAIAMLQSTNLRTLTSNLYDAFWSPFLSQMSYMFILGLLLLAIAYVRISRPSFLQKAR